MSEDTELKELVEKSCKSILTKLANNPDEMLDFSILQEKYTKLLVKIINVEEKFRCFVLVKIFDDLNF